MLNVYISFWLFLAVMGEYGSFPRIADEVCLVQIYTDFGSFSLSPPIAIAVVAVCGVSQRVHDARRAPRTVARQLPPRIFVCLQTGQKYAFIRKTKHTHSLALTYRKRKRFSAN